MKKAYRDICGRLACYADGETGEICQMYKKMEINTTVPVGGTFRIEREGVITILRRTDAPDFEVISYKLAA